MPWKSLHASASWPIKNFKQIIIYHSEHMIIIYLINLLIHLDCFQYFALMNNAVMDIPADVTLHMCASVFYVKDFFF